jgi:hypothetical protein
VIDLVLDRPRLARSQFVFTEIRGRPAIFWQTQKAARAANRVHAIPRAHAITEGFTILVDTREHVPTAFIADGLARIQMRYLEIPVVFADSRKSLRNGPIDSSLQPSLIPWVRASQVKAATAVRGF